MNKIRVQIQPIDVHLYVQTFFGFKIYPLQVRVEIIEVHHFCPPLIQCSNQVN